MKMKLGKPASAVLAAVILAGGAFVLARVLNDPAQPAVAAAPSSRAVQQCEGNAVFGQIRALTARGDHYVLTFDPAWFLSGETASAAAAEDGAVPAGEPVPNDYYIVDESHRLLMYLVQPSARVTVLVRNAGGGDFGSKAISVAQLAQLVGGKEPVQLFESLESGMWLRVHIDTACSLEQQYRP